MVLRFADMVAYAQRTRSMTIRRRVGAGLALPEEGAASGAPTLGAPPRPRSLRWDRHLKVSQNSGGSGNRATDLTLTLSLSQRERGLSSTPGLLPLPLGEGWGEGSSSFSALNRATIFGTPQVLRQFHLACLFRPNLSASLERHAPTTSAR